MHTIDADAQQTSIDVTDFRIYHYSIFNPHAAAMTKQ